VTVPAKRPTITTFKRETARRLRANATDIEDRLWRRLKRLPIHGSHFRRQVPLGPYIADFACMAARLVIEVDGSQHGDAHHVARDLDRTRWLEKRGYRVIRFWNSEVSQDMDGVLAAIHAAIYGSTEVEPTKLKHRRLRKFSQDVTPPRRAPNSAPAEFGTIICRSRINPTSVRADPPLPGEGEQDH